MARRKVRPYGQGMGDGRSFDQAVRALDKLIAERSQVGSSLPDQDYAVRRAYERIISGTGVACASPTA